MTQELWRRIALIAGILIAVAGLSAGAWWFAFASTLDQLEERGQADLALAADRLTGELQRARDLAVMLADHPDLVPLALGATTLPDRAQRLLQRHADRSGAEHLWLADRTGTVLASSDLTTGGTIAGSGAFRRALDGALGTDHGLHGATGQRYYRYAAPVFSPGGPVRGAVVIEISIAAIEWNWPADPSAVFFTDAGGVTLVSNRSDLILTARAATAEAGGGTYPMSLLRPFPDRAAQQVGGHELWVLDGGPYIPRQALHLTRPMPVIGLTAEILVNVAPARRIASLQAAAVAAFCLAGGMLLFYLADRRRALADRLGAEARAKAELEARVAERTEELSVLNENLRREIGERMEAEAALRKAQADLVQAGKLSALGQMSAGISHELNQPLMAIRSFAENGEILLERGQTGKAAEALGRISEMANRMGRIIRNLRAFARQESEPAGRVGLAAVVESALEMMGPRIQRSGTKVDWRRPETASVVVGGEVRLVQVVVNLLSNAMDAMDGMEQPRIVMRIDRDPARGVIRLTVRDSGPGLAEPDRIFDPFYTTKEVGGEGMGLGLSISYGLVHGFGGRLSGANADGGGAVFTLELEEAREVA